MSLSVKLWNHFPNFTLDTEFSLEEGVLALLGPSGCGKSMTLRCISGVEKPLRGRIVLGDRVLFDSGNHVNLTPQKRKVGHLFQNYALFPNMTLEQNLLCAIGKKTQGREAQVEQLLKRFQLTEVRALRPGQLSGGQQQRGALARCLGANPSLLLLDEPFSALDSHLKTALQLQMKEWMREFEGPVILVTHDRDEAYLLCDQIAIMDQGKILVMGEKKEVFRHPGAAAAARLTGCKNVVSAKKVGAYEVWVPEWGCRLWTKEQVPENLKAIGIRAHDFFPVESEEPGGIPVTLKQMTEFPFEWNGILLTKTGGKIHWKVSKSHLEGEEAPKKPLALGVPEDKIILLTS